MALIQSKNKSRSENLIKSLEEKALKEQPKGKGKGGKKRNEPEPAEPTNEEFEALKFKLFKSARK
jgi:hypothetical protein